MKVLVVGLGSMGKRRVRNLRALGGHEIAGVDIRDDRCEEAASKYGIPTFGSLRVGMSAFKPTAIVISTSPERHMDVAFEAFGQRVPCFIEASVVDADRIRELNALTIQTPVLIAPSCTMRYFAGPRKVKELIQSGSIGRPLNFNYHTGQFLPDWHPWEGIEEFYVSARETGGGREIVPFELTWLNDIFGFPEPLSCVKAKLTDMPADIDDIYHCLLRYPNGVLGNLTVEVISRPHATRELRVLGSAGEIVYSADANTVRCASVDESAWAEFDLGHGAIEAGYINPEEPYIAEMRDFVDAVALGDKRRFPNTLGDDVGVLDLLYRLEELSGSVP
jgi:predicted dehydrogenase